MILLDTTVVLEPLRPAPDARVIAWLDAQPMETLYLSAITVAELRAGMALLPPGERTTELRTSLEQRVLPLFAGRVLSFDLACTWVYAELTAKSRAAGSIVGTADAYIAAIAASNGFTVATRDTEPFKAAGVDFVNPWKA